VPYATMSTRWSMTKALCATSVRVVRRTEWGIPEYANTHNAPLDENMRTRFVLLNGRRVEVEVKSRWCALLSNDWTNRTQGSRRWGGRRQVRHRADNKVDAMKNTDGTRVFRSVPQCTRVRIAWALIKLSHTTCASSTRRWRICSPRATWGHVTVKKRQQDGRCSERTVACAMLLPRREGPCERLSSRTLAQEIRKADEQGVGSKGTYGTGAYQQKAMSASARIAQIV
jgi:hypothetical protein